MSNLSRAEWYAGDIMVILWKRTGHDYSTHTYANDRTKHLDVRDKTTDKVVVSYVSKTWTGVCDKIVAATETYYAIENA